MVKVQITRDCAIKGKHYGADDMAEVIEKNTDYLMASGKAMAYDGKPEPKMVKKGKKQMDLVARIRMMNYDTGGYGKLADIIIEKGVEEGFINEDDLD